MTFDQMFFHSSPSLLSVFGTLIIVCSAIYVAVCAGSQIVYLRNPLSSSDLFQVTKPNTGKHKRMQSQLPSVEDITLEEGLLAHQEDELDGDLPDKEQVPPHDVAAATDRS